MITPATQQQMQPTAQAAAALHLSPATIANGCACDANWPDSYVLSKFGARAVP